MADPGPLGGPKFNREKTMEVLFETFGVKSAFLQNQAVLSLYCCGKTTGCVLESGHGVTHSVPVYEGYYLPHAVHRLDMGGSDLTRYMMQLPSTKHPCALGN